MQGKWLVNLRSHAFGALVVGFAASVTTMLIGHMAKVGPEFFTALTLACGAVTLLLLAAAAIMGAIIFLNEGLAESKTAIISS
jgi:hypothetical protein